MKAYITILLAAVFTLGAACGSGRGDPMGVDDGSALSGQNLANSAVTEAGSVAFYMLIVTQLLDAHQKGLLTLSNYSGSGQTVSFQGAYSGSALVTATSQATSEDLLPDLSLKYNNYSGTGRLFYAGTLNYQTIYKRNASGNIVMYALWLSGTLQFAGDYAGSIEFQNIRVGLEESGALVDLIERAENPQRNLLLSGGIVIISGGVTIRTNPNSVDHPIGD